MNNSLIKQIIKNNIEYPEWVFSESLSGYDKLRIAIIKRAVLDYSETRCKASQEAIQRFFDSRWATVLLNMDGLTGHEFFEHVKDALEAEKDDKKED